MSDDITVRNNPDLKRYEARVGNSLAGFAEYVLSDGVIDFTHTEVEQRFEGKGVGSALARHALDEVKTAGDRKVLPSCPFIKAWIDRHPDYRSLL